MWLNLLVLAILGVFIALGAWRGALATGLGIATLVLAYAAAVFLGPAIAPSLGEALALGPWLALPVAGTGVFVATHVLGGVASSLIARLGRRENAGRSPGDRILGGGFGALRGLLLAVLIAYLVMWLDALRTTGQGALVPEVGDAAAARVTGELVSQVIRASADEDDAATRLMARVASRPAVAMVEVQSIVESPSFARLREDAAFWTYVQSGNVDAALNRGSFRVLQYDDAMRRQLADLGMVPEAAAEDAGVFRDSVAVVLREIGPRLQGLRDDPAFQELVRDPEVVAMLENGDTLGLLRDSRFRELMDRATSEPPRE